MGVASIPFLVSIWTAVVSILKSLWDAAKTRVVLIGIFFTKLVSWVLAKFREWGAYKVLVYAFLIPLIGIGVRSAIALIPEINSIRNGWQAVLDMMPGLAWMLWDESGPIRLVEFFRGMVTTLSAWITAAIVKFIIRNLRFNIQVALGLRLKGQ